MEIIRNRKQEKMGQRSPKKWISIRGWCIGQQTPKVKDMVIGLGKPEIFSKSPWKYKNEMGRGCPKEWSGSRMPKWIKWAEKAQNGMRINPIEIPGNLNWIKEKYMVGLKEPSKHKSSNNMTKVMEWHGKSTSRPINQQ